MIILYFFILFIVGAALHRYFNGQQRAGEPPLLRGWIPFMGYAFTFGKDPMPFLAECRQKYGEAFTVVVAGRRMTFFPNALDFSQIYKRTEEFSFAPIAGDVEGKAFLMSPDVSTVHMQEPCASDVKKLFLTHWQGPNLEETSTQMQDKLQDTIKKIEFKKYENDLFEMVSRVSYAVGTTTIFGEGFCTEENYEKFIDFDKKFPLYVAGMPIKGGKDLIQYLLNQLNKPRTNVSKVVQLREKIFSGFETHTPEQILKTHLALLWASQANTIPALFWSLYYILKNENVYKQVRQEVDQAFESSTDGKVSREALKKMETLDRSINEALRLSSSSMSVRKVMKDSSITLTSTGQTFNLRKGDELCLASALTHTSADIFPNPSEFKAERFAETSGEYYRTNEKANSAYLPFGGGVSMCPGRFLAKNTILNISIDKSVNVPPVTTRFGFGIMHPDKKLPCKITLRNK